MAEKLYVVIDSMDDELLNKKAQLKVDTQTLEEKKLELEDTLSKVEKKANAKIADLQKTIDDQQVEIDLNTKKITDQKTNLDRLVSEINDLEVKKGNLTESIKSVETDYTNRKNAYKAELGTIEFDIESKKNLRDKVEKDYQISINKKSDELKGLIEKTQKKQIYIDQLYEYEDTSNARFIREVQQILDKQGIKLNVFDEVRKHIK